MYKQFKAAKETRTPN